MGKRRESSSSKSNSRSRSRSRHRSRSSKHRSRSASGDSEGVRVHVSDIPVSCTESDLRKAFEKYGPLIEVWKTNSSPCFAFIVFKHKDNAEEAIRGLNAQYVCGNRVRVTMALPRARERRRHAVFNSDACCYQCGQPGHFSRNCRNYEGAGRNRMMPSPSRRSRRRHSSSSSSRSRSRSRSRRHRSRDRRSRSRDRKKSSDRRHQSRERRHSNREGSKLVNDEDIIAAQN